MKSTSHIDLYTTAGEELRTRLSQDPDYQPWNEYPRPQLRRDSFLNLNGKWAFAVAQTEAEPEQYTEEIIFPFAPESLLSGIHRAIPDGSYLWYRKTIRFPDGFLRDRVLLHIGAADQTVSVYVNGIRTGSHEGGYTSYTSDITCALREDEENTIVICVHDRLSDNSFPHGKQSLNPGGMWYTPVSGIWQTVWMESVPEPYIHSLRIRTGLDHAEITVQGLPPKTKVTLDLPDLGEHTYPVQNGSVRIVFPDPHCWTPEDPFLYRFRVRTETDCVESYFALRTLTTLNFGGLPRLCLNGKPYFFHGLLDQGYWSDGLYTPASPDCYAEDLTALKELGFNMVRKHIKTEPERFYYECDRLGMAVFQDLVNNGEYSFLRDTVLPTVGILNRKDREPDPLVRSRFLTCMEETVAQLYNHPCIVLWTVFNEGWGQFGSTEMYRKLRSLDPTRWIDTASGWFMGCETDVDSRHVYFRKVRVPKRTKQNADKPWIVSEFGGYVWKPDNHCFAPAAAYGYGSYKTREVFVRAFCSLYREQILPLIPEGLCAAVYTQVSDVEEEVNGLLSYDRKVRKILPEDLQDLSGLLSL